ncbi:MAG: hypothetical protein KBC53_02120 [Nitrosomonas sp.]|nr:hypothetical protein [Nitrosomonas sp.]
MQPQNLMQDQEIEGQGPEEMGNEGSAFTINSDQIEAGVKDQMDKTQSGNLDRVLSEGNKLLFGKDTHYQLMDSLQGSADISGDLGNGAFNMMGMLLKSSGNSIPGDVILPAGVILLARASEFLNESKTVQVTDDDFEEAAHLFTVKTMNAYDKDFQGKMKQYSAPGVQEDSGDEQQPDVDGMQSQGVGILGRV